jgi:serine/threonine protein kinase/Flp pilus assembly protein TadD
VPAPESNRSESTVADPTACGSSEHGDQLLLDQVYEEYLALREEGRPIDPVEFCARFPGCAPGLLQILGMESLLSRVPNALPLPEAVWPEPGARLGDVTLLREVGRGAFARAFLATEASAGDRPVVVKLSFCGQAEARTLGRLTHPNIVPILWCEDDQATGLTVVCMPFLGSATLQDVLHHLSGASRRQRGGLLEAAARTAREGDPPVDLGAPHARLLRGSFITGALHIGLELAEALAFLHRRGICHRDLKPSNILLGPDGSPRLLDFNLAVEHAAQRQLLGGTLQYAAPEQIRAFLRQPDVPPPAEPADLFSLAVILHELLTGSHPFGPVPMEQRPEEIGAVMLERQHRGAPGLIGTIRRGAAVADLDHHVAGLLDRCLAFDPGRRPSGAEVLAELRAYFRPLRRFRRWALQRRLLLLIGCGVALAISAAGLATRSTPHDAGLAALRAGRYEEAERHFVTLLASEPLNTRTRFALGCIRLKQSQAGVDKAERLALLAAARGDIAPRAREGHPLAHVCMAYCFAAAGEHEMALHHAEEAEKPGFSSTAMLNNRAFSYRLRGAWQKADDELARISRDDRDLPEVAYNRAAVVLARRLAGKQPLVPPEALTDARRAADGSDHVTACWLAARLHGLAAAPPAGQKKPTAPLDEACVRHACTYFRRCLEKGLPLGFLDQDMVCQSLKGHPLFEAVRATPQPHTLPVLPPFGLLDPVSDSGDW